MHKTISFLHFYWLDVIKTSSAILSDSIFFSSFYPNIPYHIELFVFYSAWLLEPSSILFYIIPARKRFQKRIWIVTICMSSILIQWIKVLILKINIVRIVLKWAMCCFAIDWQCLGCCRQGPWTKRPSYRRQCGHRLLLLPLACHNARI